MGPGPTRRLQLQRELVSELLLPLEAGVDPAPVLEEAAAGASRRLRVPLAALAVHLRSGRELSVALEKLEGIDAEEIAGVARCGERAGRLVEALRAHEEALEEIAETATRMRDVWIYPSIVLVVAVSTFVFWVVGPLPALARMLPSADVSSLGAMPRPALVGVGISLVVLLGFLGGGAALWMRGGDGWRSAIPSWRRLRRSGRAAQLCRTVGLLLAGGISMEESLRVATRSLPRGALRTSLEEMSRRLGTGAPVPEALEGVRSVAPS